MATTKATKSTSKTKVLPMYTSEPPKGALPVGRYLRVTDLGRAKNDWLKKGAIGKVFGYWPGVKSFLYYVRFAANGSGKAHVSILSAKRVEKAPAPKVTKKSAAKPKPAVASA